MADERLLSIDESLLKLIVTVMHDGRDMTASEIARAASNQSWRKVDRRSVEAILNPLADGFVHLAGVPPCQIIRLRRRGLLQRGIRWRLVEAPASPPHPSGAPVPAWPYPPTLSGAAAAALMFRDEEPPTNAIGKFA
jgi:hypothetical protein